VNCRKDKPIAMKKPILVFLGALIAFPCLIMGQNWPREVALNNGKVVLYQPQTDSMKGDHLYSRSAISIVIGNNTTRRRSFSYP
jgi:hypothetical protein